MENTKFMPLRENLGQQVYQHLRDMIFKMEIEPGARLGVGELADRLGVSRSPVRDALMMLVNEGVVESASPAGYRVIQLDRKFIEDAFVVRRSLELTAMRLAMGNRDIARLRAFQTVWEKQRHEKHLNSQSLEPYIQADQDFHHSFSRMSENRLLEDAISRITAITWLIARFTYATSNQERRYGPLTAEEHLHILDAMLSGKVERAVAALDDHLTNALTRALDRLDSAQATNSKP